MTVRECRVEYEEVASFTIEIALFMVTAQPVACCRCCLLPVCVLSTPELCVVDSRCSGPSLLYAAFVDDARRPMKPRQLTSSRVALWNKSML